MVSDLHMHVYIHFNTIAAWHDVIPDQGHTVF